MKLGMLQFLKVSRGGINVVPTEGTFIEEEGWVPFNSDKVLNYEFGRKRY